MDVNRGSFRVIITLLFICLSFKVNGNQFKESRNNKTEGYTSVQNSRKATINRNVIQVLNKSDNNYNINNKNSINSTKMIEKSVMNSTSDSHSNSSRKSGSDLKFSPNYLPANAVNHRPIDTSTPSPTDSQSKVSPTPSSLQNSSSTSKSLYYYSPKTYGRKTNNKHKSNVYHYPGSSTTVATTTSTFKYSTPSPIPSHYRYDESSKSEAMLKINGENPQYSPSYYPSSTQSPIYYDYEKPTAEEAKPAFDRNNSISRQVIREGVRKFAHLMNEPIVPPLDELIFDSLSRNTDMISSEAGGFNNNGFDNNRNGEVQTGTWLGPGIAGLIIGILPLVTIIASFIPAFVSVPVISTSPFSRRSYGSDQQMYLEIFNSIRSGISSLENTGCLSQMVCRFAADGRNSDKKWIQNIIYYLIDRTPDRWAKWLSVDTLFNAIRGNKCEPTYQCMSVFGVK